MTPGERLELEIYRFAESLGKGEGRSAEISDLSKLLTGASNVDSVDALIRLYDQSCISLIKYDASSQPVSFVDMRDKGSEFFYRGSFKITVTARGRLDFERKQAALPPEQQSGKQKNQRRFQTALNSYEEQGLLGEGGSATVHKVRDDKGRCYALKLMRKESSSGNRQTRFQHELNFCMRTSHPNIVEVIDHGLFGSPGCPFFVMPLFEGTLRKAMNAGIEPSRVLRAFDQVVQALEFAHEKDIFHRDLKPENILCSEDLSCVVLADFGIAHFGEDDLLSAVETRDQERLANFVYAAPEQKMRGAAVGPPADVWALGLILRELFTGQVALGKGHKVIASVAPEYEALDGLVDAMLHQSPDERPPIRSIKRQLAPFLAATARPESAPDPRIVDETIIRSELRSGSPSNVWLHIAQHPESRGLLFDVTNLRTNNIRNCSVFLTDARSFDAMSNQYRDGFGLKRRRLSFHKEILAGDVTSQNWLIRVNDDRLEVGDTTNESVLLWPKGDFNSTELWALTLLIEVADSQAWTMAIAVEWQRKAKVLSVSQIAGPEALT